MLILSAEWYRWIVCAHLFFVIAWMCGLFYLPRLFVYHATALACADATGYFGIMERKLYRFMTFAMGMSVFFGGWAAYWAQWYRVPWFMVKMCAVFFLLAYHGYCGFVVRAFAQCRMMRSAVFFRWINEIPTVWLGVAVCMVVVRPSLWG